jgi:Winged helix DNA-binding domain
VTSGAARTLTTRQLNRALLARQLLLDRASLTPPRAIERTAGLQTQYAPSAYVGLWSRLRDFDRDQLTDALNRRTVIQATLMRVTIHMVSRADYWPIAAAVREVRRNWWLRVSAHRARPEEMARLADRLREVLADGPRRRADLVVTLGLDPTTWNGLGLWVDLVRVPPSGTWERRRADVYGLAEQWVGPDQATAEQGAQLLVRRYLGGFGPARRASIQTFTGLALAEVDAALAGIGLRRFTDEEGKELLDLPGAALPDPDTPAPVRFLPTWDASLLTHARPTGILPERYRPLVFRSTTPGSVPTFLVDGAVAGTWRYADGRVEVQPFEALPPRVRREVDEEAERLAAFHA